MGTEPRHMGPGTSQMQHLEQLMFVAGAIFLHPDIRDLCSIGVQGNFPGNIYVMMDTMHLAARTYCLSMVSGTIIRGTPKTPNLSW
jgi:hypothetical protein